MKESICLFLSDVQLNDIMSSFDLREPYKAFVSAEHMTIEGRMLTDEEFAARVINTPLPEAMSGHKVEAVLLREKLFVRKGLKMLSNGKEILFVGSAIEV